MITYQRISIKKSTTAVSNSGFIGFRNNEICTKYSIWWTVGQKLACIIS